MILRIRHCTRFVYDAPAYESHNELRVAPADDAGQRCLSFALRTTPEAAVIEYNDAFGNRVHAVSIHPPHRELTIVAESVVERLPLDPTRSREVTFAEFLAEDAARLQDHQEFLTASHYVPLGDRLRRFFWQTKPRGNEDVAQYTARVVAFVRDQFEYEPGSTDVHSTVDDVLATGGGVCQDFAHLTIGLLRLAGVPARYVSGYLAQPAMPDRPETPPGQSTHAWIEALLPGSGWTGFDPTHRGRTHLRHVRVGVGRDYADVPPLRGVYRSDGQTLTRGVEVGMETLEGWAGESGQQ